ncbi:MAG: sel1 repeat family protein, partial [Lentisphaerae bacterium]|nr:sel1 repeat family protein [Lentisphaerota bacterium]
GIGVEADASEAVKWYTRAASQKDVRALVALAECYREGRGVAPDRENAKRCLQHAASLGSEEAAKLLRKSF